MKKTKSKRMEHFVLATIFTFLALNTIICAWCVNKVNVFGKETEKFRAEIIWEIEKIETDKKEVVDEEIEYKTVWTTANLNVREKNNTNSTIIGTYKKGTKIVVSYINEEWAKVKETGHFVNRRYLTEKEPVKNEDVVTVKQADFSVKEFKLTAYCPCSSCSGGWGTQTATGKKATAGRTIAVDPSVIPYGTKVEINGHTYIAEDCGGGVKGNHIDIFFDTHSEVKSFGTKTQTVKIYY